MGGCVGKSLSVEYDPQMKEKQKYDQEQEENNFEPSPTQTKLEDDVYRKQSGSKRALSLLFKQEEDEQSELLKKQGTEEKDIIQKNETPNPSLNALVSEKQENPRECEIQSVIIQEVKPGTSQPSLQQLAKDLLRLETSTADSDVSIKNERPHAQSENLNIKESNLSTTTVEVGSIDVVENVTEVDTSITGDGNEIQGKMVDTGTATNNAASLKNEIVNDDKENSLKSGMDFPFIDVKISFADVEGKDFDANIHTSDVDTSKDSDANIRSSQDPEVKVTTDNDHHKADVEDKPSDTSLPASENHVLDTNTENIVVGNCASDTIQDESLAATVPRNGNIVADDDTANEPIVELKQSSNNVQDACSGVTIPISASRQESSTVTENIDGVPVENQSNHHSNSLLVNIEESISDSSKEVRIQSDMEILADGSIEKPSGTSENTNLKPIDDNQSNVVITKIDEETIDSKEASEGEPVGSSVSTSSPMSSVVAASMMHKREREETSMTEPHGTFNLVGEGKNQMENKEIKGLDGQIEELKVSCQADHSETKAMSEKSDVHKNVNMGNETLGEDKSPLMKQEGLSHGNLLVLESAPKEKELVENGNAFSGENMEGPPVSNTLSIKQELQSEDIVDNNGTQDKSSEAKQE